MAIHVCDLDDSLSLSRLMIPAVVRAMGLGLPATLAKVPLRLVLSYMAARLSGRSVKLHYHSS